MASIELLYREETWAVRGAIFEVYRTMGCGFLESVYQDCLACEFSRRGIPFLRETEILLQYKGTPLNQTFRADFICYDAVLLEIKAVREFAPEHLAQILNYLKATGLRVGFLVNFGSYPKATIERFAL